MFCVYLLKAKNSTEVPSRAKSGRHMVDVNIWDFKDGYSRHAWQGATETSDTHERTTSKSTTPFKPSVLFLLSVRLTVTEIKHMEIKRNERSFMDKTQLTDLLLLSSVDVSGIIPGCGKQMS